MREMVINYVPGEECRVAILDNGRLEEFHAERMDSAGHVQNIYVGRVVNVEPGIQAAFIDFGLEQNGFLHISDVHPQYFPGEDEETTERVGKKTPRRERPPIQECLRRGQEIAVQVIKEGVGTKGPTVTSYLSVPGRFLVMMPHMDHVGVSRKVEDDDVRREMRKVLDELDLPDGFGFILRTAGLGQTKRELKRDLAYLQRLWKDMERRWKHGKKPRLLYSESDLLVRSLRDLLAADIDRIVIDNESAVKRAARFLKIVAPRSTTKLAHHVGKTPLFHAMGIEEQILRIHSREVPLPSGGRLVIDETEALVAIDVNSGRMRDAKDAETTAFRTNLEATDEICRQLRLRDLGGLVIHDLIDMRSAKHRKEIEARFRENLKRDRARTTILPISGFGILEMTRQRMRGSHESVHFADCPTCRGRGMVQRPQSVAADALRELSALLGHERVARVEMVVSARLSGELLSSKRRALSRVERLSGKNVEVRVSDAVPVDRVVFHAYDERGADLDVEKLPKTKLRDQDLKQWEEPVGTDESWAAEPGEEVVEDLEPEIEEIEEEPPLPGEFDEVEEPAEGKKKRRRRRRGGRGRNKGGENGQGQPAEEQAPKPAPEQTAAAEPAATGEGGKRKRRRRRGGRKNGGEAPRADAGEAAPATEASKPAPPPAAHEPEAPTPEPSAPSEEPAASSETTNGSKKRRRRRRKKNGTGDATAAPTEAAAPASEAKPSGEAKPAAREEPSESTPAAEETPSAETTGESGGSKKRRRRKRGGRNGAAEPDAKSSSSNGADQPAAADKQPPPAQTTPPAPAPRRSLYSSRRRLAPSERGRLSQDE